MTQPEPAEVSVLPVVLPKRRGPGGLKKAKTADELAAMTAAQLEGFFLREMRPEHRRVAELRALGRRPIQIARETGYKRPVVYQVMARPDVQAAYLWYRRSLHEKTVAIQHAAANTLPRGIERVSAMFEDPAMEPRHLINAVTALGKISQMGEGKAGDSVRQKIVINLSPDAARQLGSGGVGKLVEAAPIEWEEVVDVESEEAE